MDDNTEALVDLPGDVEETVRWPNSAGFELVEAVPPYGTGFRNLMFCAAPSLPLEAGSGGDRLGAVGL